MEKPLDKETIERFERRIEEIEARIKPQLDEARALRAGLSRLRGEAARDLASDLGVSQRPARGSEARRTTRQPGPARRR